MAGEAIAVAYLLSRDYEILVRNYRYRRAEIDILALQGDCLAVVEVKVRSGRPVETSSERVPRSKIKRLVMAADHFVRERRLEVEVRFDIILLHREGGRYRLEHLQNAFFHF